MNLRKALEKMQNARKVVQEAREVVQDVRGLGDVVAGEAQRTTDDLRALGEEAQGLMADARALTRPVADAFTRWMRTEAPPKPPAERVDVVQGTPRRGS